MALRDLLPLITEDPAAVALAREGGHAFASASLRPYLIAALAARNSGIRFVQNVLCIHSAKKVSGARRAASKSKPEM